MQRDLRDVVNKIIVPVGEDEATSEQMAGLASDLATFFDASVVLVHVGKLPFTLSPAGSPAGHPQVSMIGNAIEDNARKMLDMMAEILIEHGVQVKSRLVMGGDEHAFRDIIEQEKCDLVVLPHWEAGVTQRLIRVFSPSILEEATCPVLVLKGNKWLSESKAPRPGKSIGSVSADGRRARAVQPTPG